jgi:copper(I)-binding protein
MLATIAFVGFHVMPGAVGVLSAQSTTVSARDAWSREAPEGRKVTAVFVTVENKGDVARAIVGGSTDAAESAELHEMKRVGTTMEMSPVKSIALPAHGSAELKPGGLHIMLFGLKKPLAAGDTVRLTLTLDDGTKVAVAAQVRKPEPPK